MTLECDQELKKNQKDLNKPRSNASQDNCHSNYNKALRAEEKQMQYNFTKIFMV